jgi:hypothetical protein
VSVLTTSPLRSAPSAAAGVTIAYGLSPTFGAWVEVLASTAAPIAIAGLSFSNAAGVRPLVIEIGTGAAAAEVTIAAVPVAWESPSDLVSGPDGFLLPVPIGGIAAGTRVSVRGRSELGDGPTGVTLLYYESFSSDQVSTAAQVLSVAPSSADRAFITPSGTPWVSSAWVELIASAPAPSGLLGLAHSTATGGEYDLGYEYDLGLGASGAETVITTLRDALYGANGRGSHTWLPGVYPVAAGSRVSVRLRYASTNAGPHGVALLYYAPVTPARPVLVDPMFTTGGTTGPLSWIELILKTE